MKRKKITKKKGNNYHHKFNAWWKNKKILVVIFVIIFALSAIGTLIQTFYGLVNLYEDISKLIEPNKTNHTDDSDIYIDSTSIKAFLVFQEKSSFDEWHKEVKFRLGLPKYARNLSSNEVADKYLVKQYANWKKHPDSSDYRVYCGYNERLPNDLINEEAEIKYKFIKGSYYDLEEMGFISDKIIISDEEIFNYHIPEISELSGYKSPETGRNWMTSPEYNFEFVMKLFQQKEVRNKYLTDLGSINNKSRISIYLDKKDNLCFRVIDENSKSYVLRLSNKTFNKKYQFNFKFGFSSNKSYMEIYINGIPVAIKHFEYKIPFYFYKNNTITVGANLDGTYCSKIRMFIGNIFVIKDNKNISLLTYDGRNLDSIFLSDEEIIAYEYQGDQIEFYRR